MTNFSVALIIKIQKFTWHMKQLITQETDVNNILFDHVPIDTTPKVPPPPDHSLNFLDVLLPKDKWKSAVAKKKEIKKNQQKVQKN